MTILLCANCYPWISTPRAAPFQCPLWQQPHDWEKCEATIDWETQPFCEEALTAGAPAEPNAQHAFVYKVKVLETPPIIKSTLRHEGNTCIGSNTFFNHERQSASHARLVSPTYELRAH